MYLLFTRENRKFRLENQMVRIISFTLGSRGYFFLIDTDGSRRSHVNEAQSAEEKITFFSPRRFFFCINVASVSIRKKYPLEPRVHLFFHPLQSVQLIWIYFVVGHSPSTSNLIDLFFCTRFPPRWFV